MASLRRRPIAAISLEKIAWAIAVAGFLAAAPTAHAVTFQIDGASLTPGSGYGVDLGSNGENGGTLLDVQFTDIFVPQNFSLNSVNQDFGFDVGTVNFREPDAGSGSNLGIRNNEADDLGVLASFTFSSPLGAIQTLTAIGTAFLGPIADSPQEAVDYSLTWSPLLVSFGVGGLFEIDLLDLSFSNTGTQTQTATIRLLALPETSLRPTPTVPEPATLALFGLGLAGLGAVRRKKLAA